MIIFISDFDLTGSGYMNIAIKTCIELADRGWNVKALGMGYNRAEHHWPFSIIPVASHEAFGVIPAMIHNLKNLATTGAVEEIEAIIVALDIPLQQRLLGLDRGDTPYLGIFPVESGPLCLSWAHILSNMDERFVISKFGHKQMQEAGVEGIYWPVGVDTESWRPPTKEERVKLRESLGYEGDEFVVLTVADNQERKNIWGAAEIIKRAYEADNRIRWNIVTRKESGVGWKLDDLFMELGIMDITTIYERGIPHDRLWILHATSDVFLLTSKAEGLCMPIMEAMATASPVMATFCTAMPEHLWDEPNWEFEQKGEWIEPPISKPLFGKKVVAGAHKGQRGYGIPVEYICRDPWGNSRRAFVDIEKGAQMLLDIVSMDKNELATIKNKAREYTVSRSWENAGEILHNRLRVLVDQRNAKREQEKANAPEMTFNPNPPTVPSPIPLQAPSLGGIEND